MNGRGPELPPTIHATGLALLVWPILVAWLAYATGTLEGMIFGACTVFAIVALGLPAVLARIARRRPSAPQSGREDRFPKGTIETQTGPLDLRQAAFQILVIPGAVAVGFTAIAVVEVLVRRGP